MAKINSKAIFTTFLANLTIQGCNLVTGIITARLLQPVGRGELASIILWPTIFAGMGIMGTNWAMAREAAARPEQEADLARTGLVLGLVLAGLIMLVGYFAIPFLLPADKEHLAGLVRFFLLFIPLNFISLNLLALDHGRLRWGRYNLVRLAVTLPNLILLLYYWIAHIDQVIWFVMALLINNLVPLFLLIIFQREGIMRGRVRPSMAINVLRQGLPFALAALSGVVALQLDKALVVSLLSPEMVGWYAAAFAFASVHASLGGALGITSFGALANEPEAINQGRYLAGVFRQATLLYLVVGTAVALVAPLLIVPLFGASFSPAVTPAVVLALATSLIALNNILNEGLRGLGKTLPGIAAQLSGAALVALAAWWWVPPYGLLGMAGAVVVGSVLQLAIMVSAVSALFDLGPAHLWGLRRGELKILYGRVLAILPLGEGTLGE
jgi:O-antigen/teichoic acid export membrane protein